MKTERILNNAKRKIECKIKCMDPEVFYLLSITQSEINGKKRNPWVPLLSLKQYPIICYN